MLKPFYQEKLLEAGCDEAGRGCYAGPVFAAAVILPKDFRHPLLNDSKQINILKASFKAMHLALDNFKKKPQLLIIDGNRFIPYKKIPHKCFVKGDGRFASIAAASILAKTYRDEFMYQLHRQFPQYGWDKNKGYGTLVHRKAIEEFGLCKFHRKSFRLTAEQPALF